MGGRESKQCADACGKPLPADDHAAVLLLIPGKQPLRLEAPDGPRDGAAPRLRALPAPCRDLRPNATLAHWPAQGLGVVPRGARQDLQTFPRTPRLAGPGTDGGPQRQALGPLMPMGRPRAVGQGPAGRVGERVEQEALPRTATEASRVPGQGRGGGPASRRGGPPPANAATTAARPFARPMAARAGYRTRGSRC